MKVLIIEDELLIRKSIQVLATKRGHEVIGTDKGQEAIKLIEQENFDYIICDLMLGDIGGFDIIEASKRVYSPEEIAKKFIVITAYKSDDILSRVRSYNCTFFQKPIDDVNILIDHLV